MEKASVFSSETVDRLQKSSETVPTLRFTLSLTESDDKHCPEFSFVELVKSAPAKDTPEKASPWDEDGDEENLRALAKKFEEKYAPKPKKRRRDRVEDLIDVTYGYDETDPFVDDTEAYDELIPADWTTEHGGFYINQGELNFRPVSPGGDSEDEDFKKPKKVKLKSPKKIPKVPKVKKVKDPSEKRERKKSADKEKKPRKSSGGEKDKEKKHKKKHSIGSANIANLLSSPSAKNTSSTATTPPNPTPSASVVPQITDSALPSHSSPAKSLNSSQLSNNGAVKTEPGTSVIVNGNNSFVTTENDSSAQPDKVVNSSPDTSMQNGIQSGGEGNGTQALEPTLPQCLPADLESCILRLKQAGNEGGTEGKCKFFNSDVNHMLLELETKSRTLSSKVRTGIYEFLAHYLPCTKETLMKRAKKLLLNEQAGRLREPMAKLKAAVDRVMPEQVKRFEEEVKRHVEEESQKQSAKQDGENPDDHKKELFKSAMELVEDSEKSDEITTPTDPNAPAQPEDKTKKNVPKRKFIWTDELRQLLCDVVEMKIKIFEMSKTRAQSAEEHLKHFFENDVRPLWPKGWMTSRILLKESKQAHGKLTSVPARVYKKAPGPKKQGESPENQDSNASSVEVKDTTSVTSSMAGTGTTSTTAAPATTVAAPSTSLQSTSTAISVLKNLAQATANVKPTLTAPTTVIHVQKPVATTASVTKMESTAGSSKPAPELKLQKVPVITGLNLPLKDASQKVATVTVKSSLSENLPSKPTVTILDFADMIAPDGGQTETSKLLHPQQATPPKQPLASFLNKTPSSPKDKPRDQPLTHLPSSVVTTSISHPMQSSTVSPVRTQVAMSSPPKIIRSSPAAVQSTSQSSLMSVPVGSLTAQGLQNSFIDLASTMRQQQQQQQPSAVPLPPTQTILDSITSPRRPVDLKSCQASHPGFAQGMSPQSIAMSLNSAMTSQAIHQPQPANLTLFGAAANLQGKGTTPLTHIGMIPTNLQTAMLHQLSRQSQEQSGIVLPQNHFNPVLLGMNPAVNQSLPSLQLPHGALLSNQPVFQDPNQTSSSGTHPSPFLPRFS